MIYPIATASREQANGLHDVARAVHQMDRVTQSNAASAEETAASSHGLSTYAGHLEDMADDLGALIS